MRFVSLLPLLPKLAFYNDFQQFPHYPIAMDPFPLIWTSSSSNLVIGANCDPWYSSSGYFQRFRASLESYGFCLQSSPESPRPYFHIQWRSISIWKLADYTHTFGDIKLLRILHATQSLPSSPLPNWTPFSSLDLKGDPPLIGLKPDPIWPDPLWPDHMWGHILHILHTCEHTIYFHPIWYLDIIWSSNR
jgi:hypothetical protein